MRGLRPKGANPTHFFAVWGLKATTYVRLEETRFRFLGYSQIIIIFYPKSVIRVYDRFVFVSSRLAASLSKE